MAEKISRKLAMGIVRRKLKLLAAVSPQKAAEKAFTIFCTPRSKLLKGITATENKAEACSLKVDGYKIYGHRWNSRSSKKILIAHGFESCARNFEGFISPLVAKGYEVIAFDAPAHGNSEGKTIILPLYIQTLKAIYENFGPFDAYIGHSFGGLAISHLLKTIPHSNSTKVVFVAPATEIKTVMERFFSIMHLNNEVRKAFEEWSTLQTGIRPEDASVRKALQYIHASILWLHDKDDDITPFSDVEKVQGDNFGNITFVVTQGLGHRKIYRDQQTVKQIIDFL
ncbi:MAG: alpha/beta hydrolase [Bacteroidetes bacterium]|nr:alpha/beta hydrolase [Bacteroidota bacterium]